MENLVKIDAKNGTFNYSFLNDMLLRSLFGLNFYYSLYFFSYLQLWLTLLLKQEDILFL
jgi:hypothetical protein